MKTRLTLLATGLLLAATTAGFGQPTITQQPQSCTNLAGTTATFTVSATGSPPLAYQWQMLSGDWYGLMSCTNADLCLTNVQTSHAGDYRVVISNVEGAVTSDVVRLTVTLPATLQFAQRAYTVAESAEAVTLTVQRMNDTSRPVSVDYATADGTATNGLKYTVVSGTLSFAVGETNQTILVPILNNCFVDGTQFFHVILSDPAPSGAAVLGVRTNVNVTITDIDVGVQFTFDAYSVSEGAGAVQVGVVRSADGLVPFTVDFATTDVSATNGVDCVATPTTLAFAATEQLKVVSVPILNNQLRQPNRMFSVTLANVVGASLGRQGTATVTIVDDEKGFQFESANYSVREDAGVVRVGVPRGTDDTGSTVTVDCSTADVTAFSGQDYTAVNTTLTFGPGDRLQWVSVPILNDGVKEWPESFRLTLSNPTGGAVLAGSTVCTVTISDNDPGLRFEPARYTNSWAETGAITLTVVRGSDGVLGPIAVDYSTSDGSAKAGTDYQASAGTVQFEENETSKSVRIPLLRSRAAEGSTFFRVSLSNATPGVTLGTSSAVVYIVGAYLTIAPPFDPGLAMWRESGLNMLRWTGGGRLQRADSPTGPWQTLDPSPSTVQSPVPASSYRVKNPRPAEVYVPSSYDGHTPLPLVINLHGMGGSGVDQERYTALRPLAQARGFLYCCPDATVWRQGSTYWNAFFSSSAEAAIAGYTWVDDVAFLRGLIQDVAQRFALDRKRVYLIGYSNGGMMVHWAACQCADLIAGIAAIDGLAILYPHRPSELVNVLHIHGTADATVVYAGGIGTNPNSPVFPGAERITQIWADFNGASGRTTDATASLDLTTDLPGLDTTVTRYVDCPPGGAVELWTIIGGSHGPTLSPEFSPRVIDWLLAHPKP